MAEEKEEKKKPSIIRRIFKWIGLGVLSALIILGLIFQAPWKVITLLLIVLAACRILPKPAVKWFWLSVGVVIIALVIWVFLPEADGDWRPYTFDEELAALEAKRTIPDSENAAIIYNQLLESYADEDFNMPEDFPIREPWTSQDHPKIAEWLKQHQMTISTLLNASRIEKCRFAINADVLTYTMNRFSPMRQWAYLLISAASNDIAEGRTEEGLEKYIAVLQMGNHQRQQPPLIDFLVGVAFEALSIGQFKRFIVTGNTTDEHLSAIEEALGAIKYDWSTDFPRFIEYEKLFAKNFWGMFYEVNAKGKTRFIRDTGAAIKTQSPENIPPQPYWRKKLTKAVFILGWFFVPSTPQKAGAIIDAVYEKYYAMAVIDYDRQKVPEKRSTSFRLNYQYLVEHSSDLLLGVYYHIHDRYLEIIAQQRGSQIIISLRRYKNKTGQWPESLDDIQSLVSAETLVDPINNGSFVYKLTEENFTLYSKGKNNIDDGSRSYEKAGADDWLIWPPRTGGCETEEENTDDEQQ